MVLFICTYFVTALVKKACREYRYKINRTTKAIGVILSFTGKKMFNFSFKSEVPPKNSKTSRVPYLGQELSIFVNIFKIYLVRQSL